MMEYLEIMWDGHLVRVSTVKIGLNDLVHKKNAYTVLVPRARLKPWQLEKSEVSKLIEMKETEPAETG